MYSGKENGCPPSLYLIGNPDQVFLCLDFYKYFGDFLMMTFNYSYFSSSYWFYFSQFMTHFQKSIRPITLK